MGLRGRILLMAGVTVASAIVLAVVAVVLERAAVARWSVDRLLEAHGAVWQALVDDAGHQLAEATAGIVDDDRLVGAMAGGSRDDLVGAASGHFDRLDAGGIASRLDLLDNDGQVRFTTTDMALPAGLLSGWPLRQVVGDGGAIVGVRRFAGNALAVVQARAVQADGRVLGVVAAARDLADLVPSVATRLESDAFLLDSRGILLAGTNAARWEDLADRLGGFASGAAVVSTEGRSFELSTIDIAGLEGGRVGRLVIARDASDHFQRATMMGVILALGVISVVAIALLWMRHYLNRAFAPLDEAIDVLDGLSRGETWMSVERTGRNDEIGRIADSVSVFRDNIMALERVETQRQRRQRRQQRFIRAQMQSLAATLDEEPRQALLEELDDIERRAQAVVAEIAEGKEVSGTSGRSLVDELGMLAVAFQRLAERVGQQHVRLTELIAELREALAHKTQLLALQRELDIAAKVQLAILPRDFPERRTFEIFARAIPAREVGGDFYDFFAIDDHRIGIAIADVSGKGIPAAFFMLISRTLLKATGSFGMAPGACLSRLNTLLGADNEQMLFVTLFYGILDTRTGSFVYANGGHNPPYLLGKEGAASPLASAGGMALAVADGVDFAEAEVALPPGSAIVMYTDGVTEAFDAGGALYGEERLAAALRAANGSNARSLVDTVIDSVLHYADGTDQADDITCLALRYLGPEPIRA